MKKTKLSKGRFKFFLNIIMYPLFLLTFLIPKKKNLIVLGSSRGMDISDNSKYYFLYLKETQSKIVSNLTFYFLTKNKEVYKRWRNSGEDKILYLFSIRGMIVLLRSRHVFLTHALDDLIPFLLGGKTIHQFWHGTPLKKIGFDSDNWGKSRVKDILKSFLYKVFPYTNYMYCHKLYVSSPELKPIMASAFKLDEEKIIPLGQPRNDFLFKHVISNNVDKFFFKKYKKVISWLPTHRGFTGKTILDLLIENGFNKEKVNKFLFENDYIFVIKPHFVEKENLKEYLSGYSNIFVYEENDPYPLIKLTDLLITDYSSILFDYLNLDRPMVFAPFDLDYYIENVSGLYFDYNEIAFGPICYTWKEVFESINFADEKKYKDKRHLISQFFCIEDNNSSAKITNYFLKH